MNSRKKNIKLFHQHYKRFALDFNTEEEAQDFIDKFDLCEASEYMEQSMPKICKRDEWIKAEQKQLKLNL